MSAKGILGRKLGMTQIWDDENRVVPVTVIEAGPCRVVQLKTPERDGYSAVQVGTATFADPRAAERVLHELIDWCAEHGVTAVAEFVGRAAAHPATGGPSHDREGGDHGT